MRQVYGAKELSDILGVSESKSYEYIRIMNSELKEKGFLTVRGKVPAAYVQERFFEAAVFNPWQTQNQRDRLGTFY